MPIEPELRSCRQAQPDRPGSARRWRAVFGGPPKTAFHSPFPAAEIADWGTTVWAGRPNLHADRVRSPSDFGVWLEAGSHFPLCAPVPSFPPRLMPLKPKSQIAAPAPFGDSIAESQRDSGLQPRVARNELPWESGLKTPNPNGVAARRGGPAATPLGLGKSSAVTQGSSFLATLGWRTQPRWGCRGLRPTRSAAALCAVVNFGRH